MLGMKAARCMEAMTDSAIIFILKIAPYPHVFISTRVYTLSAFLISKIGMLRVMMGTKVCCGVCLVIHRLFFHGYSIAGWCRTSVLCAARTPPRKRLSRRQLMASRVAKRTMMEIGTRIRSDAAQSTVWIYRAGTMSSKGARCSG